MEPTPGGPGPSKTVFRGCFAGQPGSRPPAHAFPLLRARRRGKEDSAVEHHGSSELQVRDEHPVLCQHAASGCRGTYAHRLLQHSGSILKQISQPINGGPIQAVLWFEWDSTALNRQLFSTATDPQVHDHLHTVQLAIDVRGIPLKPKRGLNGAPIICYR